MIFRLPGIKTYDSEKRVVYYISTGAQIRHYYSIRALDS